jgi:hypothetical protein
MDGEVSRQTFDNMDDKAKLGILFDRSECMIETDKEVLKRLDKIDKRIRKNSLWDKGISAVGGFFGGIVSSVSMLIYWGK